MFSTMAEIAGRSYLGHLARKTGIARCSRLIVSMPMHTAEDENGKSRFHLRRTGFSRRKERRDYAYTFATCMPNGNPFSFYSMPLICHENKKKTPIAGGRSIQFFVHKDQQAVSTSEVHHILQTNTND
jgi:hypothetical protein